LNAKLRVATAFVLIRYVTFILFARMKITILCLFKVAFL